MVEIEETVIVEEVRKTPKPAAASEVLEVQAVASQEPQEAAKVAVEEKKPAIEASISSDSESEEEAEYHPQTTSVSVEQIKEEPEEEQEEAELNKQEPTPEPEPIAVAEPEIAPAPVPVQPVVEDGTPNAKEEAQPVVDVVDDGIVEEEMMLTPDEAPNGYSAEDMQGLGSLEEEEQEPRMNGDASHVETEHLPQVICCSEVILWGVSPLSAR